MINEQPHRVIGECEQQKSTELYIEKMPKKTINVKFKVKYINVNDIHNTFMDEVLLDIFRHFHENDKKID